MEVYSLMFFAKISNTNNEVDEWKIKTVKKCIQFEERF